MRGIGTAWELRIEARGNGVVITIVSGIGIGITVSGIAIAVR